MCPARDQRFNSELILSPVLDTSARTAAAFPRASRTDLALAAIGTTSFQAQGPKINMVALRPEGMITIT